MVRGRLAFALVLLLAPALGATAFLLPSLQPQQQPRQQAPRRLAAASSPSSSSTSSNGMAVVAKALARALAAPALLVTAMLAPSPIMLDGSGSAAWAISGGGKDWVRGVCGDLTAAVCLGRMPSPSTHPTNPPQTNNRQRPGFGPGFFREGLLQEGFLRGHRAEDQLQGLQAPRRALLQGD